jgi:hypothetical protein
VYRVKLKKGIAQRNRLATELDNDGRKKSTGILFSGILETEEEICHVC